MGSFLCKGIPAAIPYSLEDRIHGMKDIEIITASESSIERIQEFKDVIVTSFLGSETTAPEGGFLWNAEGVHSDGKPFVGSTVSQTMRRNSIIWVVNAMFDQYKGMNTCFALIDPETNKIAAATITVNNTGDKHNLQDLGVCAFIRMMYKFGLPSALFDSGEIGKRGDMIDKIMSSMHKKHGNMKHWYILMMATNPTMQGKGYGKALFNFIGELTEADGCAAYLECVGDRNTAFYSKFGYEIKESIKLQLPDKSTNSSSSDVLSKDSDTGKWMTGGDYMCVMVKPAATHL